MRLFIGLPLPEEYQKGLTKLRFELAPVMRSRLSWTREGNWHLTLKFLGEVNDAKAEKVKKAVSRISWEAFSFKAGGAGVFPHIDRPRVMWTGVTEGAKECIQLAEALARTLEPLGFMPEKRPFSPHLTLARVKDLKQDDWTAVLKKVNAAEWPRFTMGKFVLWKSVLGGDGPAYTPLAEVSAKTP